MNYNHKHIKLKPDSLPGLADAVAEGRRRVMYAEIKLSSLDEEKAEWVSALVDATTEYNNAVVLLKQSLGAHTEPPPCECHAVRPVAGEGGQL